jgi:hypothetical protein
MELNSVKEKLGNHRLEVVLLLGLFLIAFGFRTIPQETFPGPTAYDPFYHARVTRTLIQKGYIPEEDPVSYWPEHKPMLKAYPHGHHYTLAAVYEGVALLTTGSLAYNEELFVIVNNYFSALCGALAVVAMYFLGKEIRGKKAGFFAAFLLALQQTHLFRTMYGFSEEDAFGIFLLVATLAVYVYAMKKGTWKHGVLAGVVFTVLMGSWRMAMYVALLLSTAFFAQMAIAFVKKEGDELEHLTRVYGASAIVIVLLGFVLVNSQIATRVSDFGIIVFYLMPTLFLLLVATYQIKYKKQEGPQVPFLNITKKRFYLTAIAALVLLAVIFSVFQGGEVYQKAINTIRVTPPTSKLSQTVGEAHPRGVDGVLSELRFLSLFFVAAMIYLPVRRIAKWKEPKVYDLLPFIFGASTFFMYVNEGKMGYVFAPASCIVLGIFLADSIGFGEWMEGRGEKNETSNWIKRVSLGAVILLSLTYVPIAMGTMEGQKGSYTPQIEWRQMYAYMNTLPNKEDVVFLTWWDYGHWSAWYNFKTTLDNTNYNASKVMQTARIFTDFRGNTSAELEERHLDEIRDWEVTHVAIDRILLHQKWGALTFLGDNRCIPTDELKKYGLDFPYLTQSSEAICGPYYTQAGSIGISGAKCQKKTQPQEYVECNIFKNAPLRLEVEEWENIKNATWPGYVITVTGVGNIRVYGQPDDRIMFFYDPLTGAVLPDAPINHMLGFRWFFKDPNLKYSKLVEAPEYNVPSREVVLYEINYTGFEESNETKTGPKIDLEKMSNETFGFES